MKKTHVAAVVRIPLLAMALLATSGMVLAQAPGGPGGFGGPGGAARRPAEPPAPPQVAAIPAIKPLTGPGKVYDSASALWPGKGLDRYNYVADEYLLTGTAAGDPYVTRLVIRKPREDRKFSGLVIAEPMHPSAAAAHAFEYNSLYIMDTGHIAVEIDTTGVDIISTFNPERYGNLKVSQKQVSEILAQAGALVKSPQSPIANLKLRKMILWGTSASSGMVVNYLPSHKVFKQADMSNIYDGFMPTMNGSNIQPWTCPSSRCPRRTSTWMWPRPRRTAMSPAGSSACTKSSAWRTWIRAHPQAPAAGRLPAAAVRGADRRLRLGGAASPAAVGGQGHRAAEGAARDHGPLHRERRLADAAG